MKVPLSTLSGAVPSLAGATRGRQHLCWIVDRLRSDGELVLLDFAGIESATSSYLKALVFPFMRDGKTGVDGVPQEAFPVVCGASDLVREELRDLTSLANRQIVEALELSGEELLRGRLYGTLDAALRETLLALVRRGATTATELHAEAGASLAITAFNNRLADLHAKRLARRRRSGKQWVYEPIARGFDNG